jgi:hypothetical protein
MFFLEFFFEARAWMNFALVVEFDAASASADWDFAEGCVVPVFARAFGTYGAGIGE